MLEIKKGLGLESNPPNHAKYFLKQLPMTLSISCSIFTIQWIMI